MCFSRMCAKELKLTRWIIKFQWIGYMTFTHLQEHVRVIGKPSHQWTTTCKEEECSRKYYCLWKFLSLSRVEDCHCSTDTGCPNILFSDEGSNPFNIVWPIGSTVKDYNVTLTPAIKALAHYNRNWKPVVVHTHYSFFHNWPQLQLFFRQPWRMIFTVI